MRGYAYSFVGGEVTPEFWGQIADAKFATGLAKCRNFRVLPHGPLQNRAGFEFVREVKDSSKPVRLLPFVYSTAQTLVIEAGDQYMRYHSQGATIISGGVPYETTTPYAMADLSGLKYTQSSDVMTLVHTGYAPAELCRTATGGFAMTYSPIAFSTALDAPTSVVASATIPTTHGTPTSHTYAVTSVAQDGLTESLLSSSSTCSNNLYDTGAFNTITWTQAVDALRYNVYKQSNGLWGYVGQASGGTFVDDNITPDISQTPPIDNNPFYGSSIQSVPVLSPGSGYRGYFIVLGAKIHQPGLPVRIKVTDATGSGAVIEGVTDPTTGAITGVNIKNGGSGYTAPTFSISSDYLGNGATFGTAVINNGNFPGAVAYFEQRRCFAGTLNKPQSIWMTKSGTESDMRYSIPSRDSDSINFRVVAREANTIRHLVPMANLAALTSAAEWRVASVNSDALTPISISVKPQSFVGANDAQPAIVNTTVIYAAARGGHVREMAYNWQAGGYITGDLSLRAPHLFDGFEIVDIALSKAPYPIVWMVSSSGLLLGFTYVPEQQVGSWHWHDTDGAFESCAVVAEGDEDVLYVVVRRQINGQTKRYVERMRPRAWATPADAFHVDCGATYSGPATATITGLDWLEGKTVSILADGAVHPQRVVTGGAITLDIPSSKVQVGLPFQSDMQTLPLALHVDGYGQGRPKNVNKVWLRVYESGGFSAGPDFNTLVQAKVRTDEPYGSPVRLQSREIELVIRGMWGDSGQACVRMDDPLPLTVVNMSLDVAVGG